MIKVYQRIIDQGRGDCFTAAIASIFELPYEQVPTWVADAFDAGKPHRAWHDINAWLRERGFHQVTIKWEEFQYHYWNNLEGVECLLSVPSQRFPGVSHAVIGSWMKTATGGHQLIIIHDPNPTNAPYPADVEPKRVTFLVPLHPRVDSWTRFCILPPPADGKSTDGLTPEDWKQLDTIQPNPVEPS